MKNIFVFLADGFEEIEGLTSVDLLRRTEANVVTVSVTGRKEVRGTHDITVLADEVFDSGKDYTADAVILPGGLPGTDNLRAHEGVKKAVMENFKKGNLVCAICAAPSIFGDMGILEGKKATSYPSFTQFLKGAEVCEESAVIDKNVITSRGLGTAIDFALLIIKNLYSEEKALEIKERIIY